MFDMVRETRSTMLEARTYECLQEIGLKESDFYVKENSLNSDNLDVYMRLEGSVKSSLNHNHKLLCRQLCMLV